MVTSATPAASGERFNSSAINQMHISRSLYRLGAEALGWDNSTAEGKALIAEDMKLLKRLQLANAKGATGSPTYYLTSGQAIAIAAARPLFIS